MRSRHTSKQNSISVTPKSPNNSMNNNNKSYGSIDINGKISKNDQSSLLFSPIKDVFTTHIKNNDSILIDQQNSFINNNNKNKNIVYYGQQNRKISFDENSQESNSQNRNNSNNSNNVLLGTEFINETNVNISKLSSNIISKKTTIASSPLQVYQLTNNQYYNNNCKINKNNNGILKLICIGLIVIIWIGYSQTLKYIEFDDNKPFFVKYIGTSSLIILIIPYMVLKWLTNNDKAFTHNINEIMTFSNGGFKTNKSNFNIYRELEPLQNKTMKSYSMKNQFLSTFLLSFLWVFSTYLWYCSMYDTIPGVNNTIFLTNCMYTIYYITTDNIETIYSIYK